MSTSGRDLSATYVRAFHPAAYGAVGDGVADDRAALQATINAAAGVGFVQLPPGKTYIAAGTLSLPSGTIIRGAGPTSIIRAKPDAADTAGYLGIVNADTANGNDNITLEDFTYDGNRQNRGSGNPSNCIRFLAADTASCDNIRVSGVTVLNAPFAAMQFMNCSNLQVTDNHVDDTMRDGITVWYNSQHVTIANNIILNTRDDCIALNSEAGSHTGTQIKYATITGNVCQQATDSTYGTGINSGGATNVTITGNVIQYAQGFGIVSQGGLNSGASLPSKRVTITGNTIRESGTAASGGGGIAVSNTDGCSVSSNIVEGYYGNGIQLNSRASVTGNTLRAGKTANSVGVLAASSFASITGNNFYNCTAAGVSITAEKNVVSGNTFEECCTLASTSAYVLVSGGNSRNVITGNIFRRTTYGTYGVRLATGAGDFNVVTANVTQGFPAGQGVSSAATGTANVVANNATP